MSKSLRLSEKWFRRGLWVIAFVFAAFLIGLGNSVVGDLPKVEQNYSLEQFSDQAAMARQRQILADTRASQDKAKEALDQAHLKLKVAQSDTASEKASFNNWLSARSATERSDQDPQVIARTHALDDLHARERAALAQVQAHQQVQLDAQQATNHAQNKLQEIIQGGQAAYDQARKDTELRVFLYRLALTLPLLCIAGWLFVKKRKSAYWPFVWGFIIFALFAFFVELVPYLPSWGGYVRYIVGIGITVLVGRYAIVALNDYLERQRQIEKMPDAQRRKDMDYDVALGYLAKNVCPGCERPVDIRETSAVDFCPHCGIGLHVYCGCGARMSAFAHFCHKCGAVPAKQLTARATVAAKPKVTAPTPQPSSTPPG